MVTHVQKRVFKTELVPFLISLLVAFTSCSKKERQVTSPPKKAKQSAVGKIKRRKQDLSMFFCFGAKNCLLEANEMPKSAAHTLDAIL